MQADDRCGNMVHERNGVLHRDDKTFAAAYFLSSNSAAGMRHMIRRGPKGDQRRICLVDPHAALPYFPSP